MNNVNRRGDATNELASGVFSIAPNDSTDLTRTAYGLYVTNAGTVKLDSKAGDTVTISATNFQTLDIIATKVYSTGTTATGIFGLD